MRLQQFYFILLFSLFLQSVANGQLNIAVGYEGSYMTSTVTNQIIDRYNTTKEGLEEKFSNLHYMHGLAFGARYRWNLVGVEAMWIGRFRDTNASGVVPGTTNEFSRSLDYRYNSYSIGLDNYIGRFSFGGTLALDDWRIKSDTEAIKRSFKVVEDMSYSSQFYIMYTIPGAGPLSVGVRPFVRIPWIDFNQADLEREIIPANSPSINPDDYNEKPISFGIMFIFYNGKSAY